jgi:uncharacterized integral membrane protein
LRNAVLAVLGLLLLAFVLLNLSAFTTPQELSLGIRSVEAPLGLVMLGVLAFALAIFAAYFLTVRATKSMEERKQAKALLAAHKLAEDAELSRLAELSARVETGFAELQASIAAEGEATRRQVEHSVGPAPAGLAEAAGVAASVPDAPNPPSASSSSG